ncbi:MAG TPA: protein-disulfide reductase DsbD N-terminal domain-containing protein [Pyrinomonadaceae bacterium]|nr:protein-disulfide reductase DsbD N-terminal domain-containing protein [Pyrinomonadaceae bacterium]
MKLSNTTRGATLFMLAIGLLALSGSGSKVAAQSPPHINVTAAASNHKVNRGRTLRATVTMEIPGDYHVNSARPLEKFLIPTTLKVSAPDGIRIGPIAYPRAVLRKFKFSKNNVSVYEGRAVMRFTVTVPAATSTGAKELKLSLRYQSCNDEVCFPPQTKDLSLWVHVE